MATLLVLMTILPWATHGQSTTSTTVSQAMPPSATAGFNVSAVDSSDAFAFCQSQLNTCPIICGGNSLTGDNKCDQTTLTYTCVCSNGTVPDCTAFVQTLPYYICLTTYLQCLDDHPNDLTRRRKCLIDEDCGTRNATAELLARQASETSSTTTLPSSSPTSSDAAARPHSSLSTGATAGIGVGCGIAGLIVAALAIYAWRRHHRAKAARGHSQHEAVYETIEAEAELHGDPRLAPSVNILIEPTKNPELATNANRHELDSHTYFRTGDAELEG
ncbi:hypothetical protein LTR10_019280 [Elasticomyces elasticus]|uniref:DUF7707 domain-containing protein n=1 Tax=Exophiala sideris TaxID=1016849 RepID=A0ABR0IWX0_9EURO|nr:hypothetical protein LTR10_019280 [Elasticomyces elasticus]KAK5021958.1 hypothetical protein LTS07_010540 [Exophiala sideris]KAK5026021.1 hypothetical protein LTR13_010178 [Exophiala sideris]KAK5050708.1 hypothetical protein LTR69_010564 [Exophiala sideris]KAK5177193.1 hypothetical protein LTR44_010321 [Eurotiomycetes sp. CCFEE 6388]